MTPAEKALIKNAEDRLMEPTVLETDSILRVTAIRDDWPTLPLGTIIGLDYTRMNGETTILVKRRGEMTVVGGITAVNRELKTGLRAIGPEDIVKDVLGGLYLWDEKATADEVAERKRIIKEMAEAKKAAKSGAPV